MHRHGLTILGTGSDVGKSVTVAALCRIYARRGFNPAPFKSQNMALNSFITEAGDEIGRAQAFQARAAGIPCTADMNPVLLKPMGDTTAQVIVQGKVYGNHTAKRYDNKKESLFPKVIESFERLRDKYSPIFIEGAGSPAEVNLAERDIANLRIAEFSDFPVIIIGDIDKGGVFASLIGTLELIPDYVKRLVSGIIINKFRGDIDILKPGIDFLEERTRLPVFGVIPWFHGMAIEEEDSQVGLSGRFRQPCSANAIEVAVIKTPYLSNVTDFLALEEDSRFFVRYVERTSDLGAADIAILPGTKKTIHDLEWIRARGFDRALRERLGTTQIIGICGGYQMLGLELQDGQEIESDRKSVKGLAFLPVVTRFEKQKQTRQVEGELLLCESRPILKGYEIHHGISSIIGEATAVCSLRDNSDTVSFEDGAAIEGGDVFGCYMHGFFDTAEIRDWLASRHRAADTLRMRPLNITDESIDLLADHFDANLDLKALDSLLGLEADVQCL